MCVCVCVCVHAHTCTYACMHVCKCLCACVCAQLQAEHVSMPAACMRWTAYLERVQGSCGEMRTDWLELADPLSVAVADLDQKHIHISGASSNKDTHQVPVVITAVY